MPNVKAAPSVSILTASFNALAGLRETVESVASQTASDHEHIVIDGGSTDGSREWLAELDGTVRWISEPDEGIADALNKGLAHARGEWILVLQAEDTFVSPGTLEQAMRRLDTESDIVSHDVLVVTDSGSRRFASRGFSYRINFKTTIPHQGAFCRRQLFDRIGGFDNGLRVALDYDFFLRAYRAGARADVVHRYLSKMPNTGISTRLDWSSLRARFAEEHEIHRRLCSGSGLRISYSLYWPLYLTYRRIRYLTSARTHGDRPMGSP